MTNRVVILAATVLAILPVAAKAQQPHLCQPRVADHVCMSWHAMISSARETTRCDRLMMIEPSADGTAVLTCDNQGEGVVSYRHQSTRAGDRFTLIER